MKLWVPGLPKLKKCFWGVDLRVGSELACYFAILNKVSGLYGFVALFTGASVSGWQMSMYIYSIAATVLFLLALRHVHEENASRVLLFAYFYLVDIVINVFYTVLFATSWFLLLSASGGSGSAAGEGTMSDNSGFTNPTQTVSHVYVVPTPAPGKEKVSTIGASGSTGGQSSMQQPETIPSLIVIVFFWLLKMYSALVVFSYARKIAVRDNLLRQASLGTSWLDRTIAFLLRPSYFAGTSHERMKRRVTDPVPRNNASDSRSRGRW